MENGTVQKGQNLLEDFVWPIDTGRLMGDPLILASLSIVRISYKHSLLPHQEMSVSEHQPTAMSGQPIFQWSPKQLGQIE